MAERTAILIDSDGNRLGVEDNPLYIEGIVAVASLVELTDVSVIDPASGDYIGYDAATGKYINKPVTGSGMGDVTGPSGAVAGNFPILDSSGKILEDSGYDPSDFLGDVVGPSGATAGNFPVLDATGKVLSDSGKAPADYVEFTIDGNIDIDSKKVINLGNPGDAQDAATKYYVDQMVFGLSWKEPCIDIVTASPSSPTLGDRYIVASEDTTGAFVGHNNSVATYGVGGWAFELAEDGGAAYVSEKGTVYVYNGADGKWVSMGTAGVSLGETSDTAYRGDRGKIAYDHSVASHAPWDAQKNSDITKGEIEAKLTGTIDSHTHTGVGVHGSSHISTGADAIPNAVASGASGLLSGTDKAKLDGIAAGANNYSLPTASADVLGGVKIGSGITITDGVISASSEPSEYAALVQRSLEGVVYETTLMYWRAPAACTIDSCSMSLSSNPSATGSYCKVQVMKNGTLETNSIFSADTPMQITELTSASNGIYTASGTLDSNQTTLASGDVIQFRVNQADTGSADLLVQMKVTFT